MDWDLDEPHEHEYHADQYPSDDLRKNFCRNPGSSNPKGPWCFTTDPSKRWDYCAPIEKTNPEGLFGAKATKYTGKQTKTRSGKTCQAWNSQSPHKHESANPENQGDIPLVENFCRNPMGKFSNIWCYTTVPKKTWEYCDPILEGESESKEEPKQAKEEPVKPKVVKKAPEPKPEEPVMKTSPKKEEEPMSQEDIAPTG